MGNAELRRIVSSATRKRQSATGNNNLLREIIADFETLLDGCYRQDHCRTHVSISPSHLESASSNQEWQCRSSGRQCVNRLPKLADRLYFALRLCGAGPFLNSAARFQARTVDIDLA